MDGEPRPCVYVRPILARSLHMGRRYPSEVRSMKATKFIILVGGFLGLISFFVPILSSTEFGEGRQSFSAFQIIKGLNAAQKAVDNAAADADSHIRAASASAIHDTHNGID